MATVIRTKRAPLAMSLNTDKIETLEQLQLSKLPVRTILNEVRENLCTELSIQKNAFQQLANFEPTVIQSIESALLSKQHFVLFGEGWNNKSLIIRCIINFLDEFTPYITGNNDHEHPYFPITRIAQERLLENHARTKVSWLEKNKRILVIQGSSDTELDKSLTFQKFNRKIVIIKHLDCLPPDKQFRLIELLKGKEFINDQPVPDCLVIGTVNSSNYADIFSTNLELMDCFGAFINTYQPPSVEELRKTTHDALLQTDQKQYLNHELAQLLHEECVLSLQKEGWLGDLYSLRSTRMRLFLSAVIEKRVLLEDSECSLARIIDFYALSSNVFPYKQQFSQNQEEQFFCKFNQLIGNAIKKVFVRYFPDPEKYRRTKQQIPYLDLLHWFNSGNKVTFSSTTFDENYQQQLIQVSGLVEFVKSHYPAVSEPEIFLFMELLLHGLAEFSFLNKTVSQNVVVFQDMIGNIFRKPVDGGDNYLG